MDLPSLAEIQAYLQNAKDQYMQSDIPAARMMRGEPANYGEALGNALQASSKDPMAFVGSIKSVNNPLKNLVLDSQGNPLTLYHGGPKFEGKFKIPTQGDKGIYFTDNPYFAQDQFALQHELAMRDKTGFGYDDVPEHMLESGEWDPKYFKFADVKKVNLQMKNPKNLDALDAKVIPKLYDDIHDGIIVKSTGDFGYSGGQYVVFDPDQIKILDPINKAHGGLVYLR